MLLKYNGKKIELSDYNEVDKIFESKKDLNEIYGENYGYISEDNKFILRRIFRKNLIKITKKKYVHIHIDSDKQLLFNAILIYYMVNNNIEVNQRSFDIEKYRMYSRMIYNHDPSMEEIIEAIG